MQRLRLLIVLRRVNDSPYLDECGNLTEPVGYTGRAPPLSRVGQNWLNILPLLTLER